MNDSGTILIDGERQSVLVDDTDQRSAEHNRTAFTKTLHEDGFPGVVVRAVSGYTLFVHTRTLTRDEREAFRAYAEKRGLTELESDLAGEVYRVDI